LHPEKQQLQRRQNRHQFNPSHAHPISPSCS
jgi:hypothetical protein